MILSNSSIWVPSLGAAAAAGTAVAVMVAAARADIADPAEGTIADGITDDAFERLDVEALLENLLGEGSRTGRGPS